VALGQDPIANVRCKFITGILKKVYRRFTYNDTSLSLELLNIVSNLREDKDPDVQEAAYAIDDDKNWCRPHTAKEIGDLK